MYIYSDVSNVRRVETEDCRILEANHISKFPQIQSQWIGLENPQETIDFMSFFMALSCKNSLKPISIDNRDFLKSGNMMEYV